MTRHTILNTKKSELLKALRLACERLGDHNDFCPEFEDINYEKKCNYQCSHCIEQYFLTKARGR